MTHYTLPFLFLNLGGEMVYILDQRLRAQNIAVEKARKVLDDIVRIMFNPRFIEELFKPQEIYNKSALKALFHDLAHASIMRLNETSMNKLYDLMTMVFKWQVFSASHPRELVLITLNHLDSIRTLVSCPTIHKQLDTTYFMFIKTYGQMTCGELQRVRYSLLNFLQDVRIRVSLLLRQRLQNPDGSFVIPTNMQLFHGSETPGKIRIYSREGIPVDLISFYSGGKYSVASQPGSTELRGIRYTHLGTNIYSASRTETDREEMNYDGQESYKKEINLLVAQLGHDNVKLPDDSFPLQLFNTNEEHQISSLDVLRGSYLHARDSVVPRDVFHEGHTGFGHSSIFSDMQASETRTKLVGRMSETGMTFMKYITRNDGVSCMNFHRYDTSDYRPFNTEKCISRMGSKMDEQGAGAGAGESDDMASSTVNPHTEALSKILAEMQPTITKDQSEFDLLDLMEELS